VFVTKPLLSAFVAVALLAVTERGFAENEASPLDLAWQSPPECPTGTEITEDALRLASADGRPLPRVQAKVTIERAGDSEYLLSLTTPSAASGSTQRFRAGTCRAVAQAAAITLALLLNPAGTLHSSEPAEPAPHLPTAPPPTRSLRLRAAVAGLVGVQFGMLPQIGPTLGAELGLLYGRASGWLGGAYGPQQQASVDGHPGVGGELSLARALFFGCWSIAARNPQLDLCTGLDLSRVSGHGMGVADERVGSIHWFSGLGGVLAQVAVHKNIALRFRAFAAVPLSHPSAFVEGAGTVYQPGPVAADLNAGVAAVWP